MAEPLISVGLVTWNSASCLAACLSALARQKCSFELIVVDNASTDRPLEVVSRYFPDARVIINQTNTGFCQAQNQAIVASKGLYYMALNPDVFLKPDFLTQAVRAIELDQTVGQVSGKLYRVSSMDQVGSSRMIDSAGMYFSTNQRHFDRGAGETDTGQYDRLEYVFGVSGAAAFYRKAALQDAAIGGEYFDESFFAYREDADLSWRLQLLGWKALYAPEAQAYHFRTLRSDARRSDVDAVINMHSVQNRFLMRIKNQTWKNGIRFLIPTFFRDLLVIGYVLLSEHTSLPAFGSLLTLFPEVLRKRHAIMSKRRVGDAYMAGWFTQRSAPFTQGGGA
jgi:GT2 family glycosyltransferase